MADDIKEKSRRFYCPEHEKGFEIAPNAEIYCRTGKHFLVSEFPPQKDYLEYCCGCQRFIPFTIIGDEKETRCPSCEREIGERYFCHQCLTLTNDIKKFIEEKKFEVSAEGEIQPNCPACTFKNKNQFLHLHICRTLKTDFFTSRKICEFCQSEIKPKNTHPTKKVDESPIEKTKASTKSDTPTDQETKTIQETEEITKVREIQEGIKETIVADFPPDEGTPIVDTTEDVKKKSATGFVGCIVALVTIIGIPVLCIVGLFSRSATNSFSTSTPSNISANTFVNSPKNTNDSASNNNLSRNTSLFRSNSNVILDGAVLRDEPEYNGYIITSIENGTNIRVIDRKSSKSPWYKVKTETGEEGWIHGDYIDAINWKSYPCKIGETGYISGGNLRSSPMHSVNESNILAIWDKGSRIKVIDIVEGEPGQKSGNPYWFKVEILEGVCSLDARNPDSLTKTCKNRTMGYINSFLVSCD